MHNLCCQNQQDIASNWIYISKFSRALQRAWHCTLHLKCHCSHSFRYRYTWHLFREPGVGLYPLPCLTRVWWPVYHPCPPMKFFHNNWVGWESVEPVETEILFSSRSPLLNLHLKVFTKLHDFVSRIQNSPASDRVWGGVWGSNIPLKHLHARQKIGGLSVTKAIKIGSYRGHLGTSFQPI